MSVDPSDLAATLVARRRADRERQRARAARLRSRLPELGRDLRSSGSIDAVWLIGSLAWGEFGVRSDVDLVVRGAGLETVGALTAIALDRLGPDAEERIDVLRFEDLPPSFRERVLAEGQRLDEP